MSIRKGNKNIAGNQQLQKIVYSTTAEVVAGTDTSKVVSPKACNEAMHQIFDPLTADAELKANKGQPNGYCPLSSSGKVPDEYIDGSYTRYAINSGSAKLLNAPGSGTVEVEWAQPILSSNGTMGGNDFACAGDAWHGAPYMAFDGNASTQWGDFQLRSPALTFYIPIPVRLKSLDINAQATSITLYLSNDNSSWVTYGTVTSGQELNITTEYKYYKLAFGGSGAYWNEDLGWCYTCKEVKTHAMYTESVSSAKKVFFNVTDEAPLTYTDATGESTSFTALEPICCTFASKNYIASGGEPLVTKDGIYTPSTAYIRTKTSFVPSTYSWEMYSKFQVHQFPQSTAQYKPIYCSYDTNDMKITVNGNKKVWIYLSDGTTNYVEITSTTNLTEDTWYSVKLEYTVGTTPTYTFTLYDEDDTQLETSTVSATAIIQNQWYISIGSNGTWYNYLNGKIDVCASYIKINDTVWWTCLDKVTNGVYNIAIPKVGDPYLYGGTVFNTYNTALTNVIKHGNVVVEDGVATGFSTSSYLTTDRNIPTSTADSWTLNTRVKFNSIPTSLGTFIGDSSFSTGLALNLNTSGNILLYLGNSAWNIANGVASTNTVVIDKWYNIQVAFNGTTYTVSVCEDDEELETWITVTSSVKANISKTVFGCWSNTSVSSYIDLNNTNYQINNGQYWKGVGFIVKEGDIWLNNQEPVSVKQYTNNAWVDFDDLVLLDTSIEVSDGVVIRYNQPQYNNTYLLNNKEYISSVGMPSDRYINLTLLASGSSYTAPANGYFYVDKIAGSDYYWVGISNTNTGLYDVSVASSGNYCTSICPALQGEKVVVSYNATGALQAFRFYYTNGETV